MKKETSQQIREKVVQAYDAFARDWDTTRQVAWPEFELVEPKLKNGLRVLDLGCGNGRFFEICKKAGVEYTGVDNSAELINLAQKNFPEGKFVVGDALDLPFSNASFDLVVSLAVIHHIPGKKNQEKFLQEISRVLKKDGEVFLTSWNIFQPRYRKYIWENRKNKLKLKSDLGWNDAWIPFGNERTLRFLHGFTPREMRKLLEENFKIEGEYFTRKNTQTKNWKEAYNLCWLAKKS